MKNRIKTWIRLLAVCSVFICIHRPASSQTYIRNTDWNGNDTTVYGSGQKAVRCIITLQNQPDPADNGKMILVGDFTRYDGVYSPHIVRLNVDGSIDKAFGTTPLDLGGQSLLTVTEDPKGNLLIGGMFKEVNGQAIGGIARLDPKGNLDPSFTIGTGFGAVSGQTYPEVHKILIKNDPAKDVGDYGISVGGLFKSFNGVNTDGGVKGGLVQLNFDGSYNRSFKVTDDCCSGGGVRDMVFDNDGNIVVVGEFGVAGGVTTKRVARLLRNGGTAAQPTIFDPSFKPLNAKVPNNAVNSVLVLPDNKILIGGKFTAFLDFGPGGGGNPMPEVGSYLARLNPNGTLDIPSIADPDPDFIPVGLASPTTFSIFEAGVQALKLDPMGRILVGGRFANPKGNLFRLDANGVLDNDFNINAGFNGPVLDFVFRDILNKEGDVIARGELIVTVGDFTSFDNVSKQQNVLELGNAIVLATTTIKLNATKINNTGVKLQWAGTSDIQTYELQRSGNGIQFQTIASRSTSTGIIIYNDQSIQGYPVLYYRLLAKGKAGEIHYSDVVKLSFTSLQASLQPLSATSLKLTYIGNVIYGDKLIIQSITADGKLIWQKQITARGNSINTVISLPAPLSNGFLLLRDEQGTLLYKTYYMATSK